MNKYDPHNGLWLHGDNGLGVSPELSCSLMVKEAVYVFKLSRLSITYMVQYHH